ncbi:cysteine proteinase [Aspergillus fijiensis CBS 313.89]|uniref:Cysteine proteinase n=1 Tax=Aspergillus fijiensis CBS 313.89 TaxID=1448319 RepID=A0A8G1W1N5_9EURO|nr:cysteine proteinase [Aspergillus fijiensis CBS 313.89]RAK77224.1 cysteine proteinase [Aspergillus fijiensis CBS 313.89]
MAAPQAPDPPTPSTPQTTLTAFWNTFIAKTPGKVTTIFPQSLYADLLPSQRESPGQSSARNAAESYEAAARQCRAEVQRIVRECHRVNEKFTDPEFDLENDRELELWNCLRGLVRGEKFGGEGRGVDMGVARGRNGAAARGRGRVGRQGVRGLGTKADDDWRSSSSSSSSSDDNTDEEEGMPGSVHRVDWIFEDPRFTIDGYSNTDIKQGANGDCWWLAAVATICNRPDLMERICLARDEECGVYGFVFYRDGEWVSTVVDDNLYLAHEDFDFYGDRYDSTGRLARQYRKRHQTGSEALYFAKCSDANETWLPLLEKAYAKVHGDYEALSGGWSGEAVEDMTGGVTTTIATNKVLNKNTLWRELVNAERDFVFAASALGSGRDWTRGGLALGHAYSILRATEEEDEDGKKVRLVLVRNPWGERNTGGVGEWNGPWSDGSREWTPYWLQKLQHRFGDDGMFWMAYEDLLSTFVFLHRTRIFDETWTVVQRWTSVSVPWIEGYLRTKFVVEIRAAGPVVFVLSEVDKRYMRGLEGQYDFALHFLLQEENAKPGEHLLLVRPVQCRGNRSISAEVKLEPGRYEILIKLLATRDSDQKNVEDVVKEWVEKNPQKLKQVAMNYDLANAKVQSGKQIEAQSIEATNATGDPGKEEASKSEAGQGDAVQDEIGTDGAGKDKSELTESANDEPANDQSVKKADDEKAENSLHDSSKEENCKREGHAAEPSPAVLPAPGSSRRVHEGKGKDVEKHHEDNVQEDTKHLDKQDEDNRDNEKKHDGKRDEDNQQDDKKHHDNKDVDKKDDKQDDDKKDQDKEEATPHEQAVDTDGSSPSPWNAICVLGLRVYARDPQVSIELVR